MYSPLFGAGFFLLFFENAGFQNASLAEFPHMLKKTEPPPCYAKGHSGVTYVTHVGLFAAPLIYVITKMAQSFTM